MRKVLFLLLGLTFVGAGVGAGYLLGLHSTTADTSQPEAAPGEESDESGSSLEPVQATPPGRLAKSRLPPVRSSADGMTTKQIVLARGQTRNLGKPSEGEPPTILRAFTAVTVPLEGDNLPEAAARIVLELRKQRVYTWAQPMIVISKPIEAGKDPAGDLAIPVPEGAEIHPPYRVTRFEEMRVFVSEPIPVDDPMPQYVALVDRIRQHGQAPGTPILGRIVNQDWPEVTTNHLRIEWIVPVQTTQ